MSELEVLLLITGIGYTTLIPATFYALSYLEKKKLFLLSCTLIAYACRIVLKAIELAFFEHGLQVYGTISSTLSAICIFLALIGVTMFLSAILEQKKPVGSLLFYIYAFLSLLIVLLTVDLPEKRFLNLFLAIPYISIVALSVLFRPVLQEEPAWFLSRFSRLTLAVAISIIVTGEISLLFMQIATYYIILLFLALVLLLFTLLIGSFKTTAYFLEQLDLDYLIVTKQGYVIAVSSIFRKNSPFNLILQSKKPRIEELSRIVDLDDLLSLKALQTFYSRILTEKTEQQVDRKDLLTLKFITPAGDNRSYILKTVPCSILTVKKYWLYLVLFEPLGSTSTNSQLAIAEQLSKDYLSLVAHDLRNSLVTASGYVSLLKRNQSSLDEKTLERYEIIKKNFFKMEALVDKISTMAKRKKQEEPLVLEEVSIFDLLTRVVDDLKLLLLMKTIKLELSINPPEDHIIRANGELLTIAMENLVHNAVKYSSEGSTVTMECYKATGVMNDQVLVFDITDRGIGIPVTELSGLFSPNFRASNVFDMQGEGIGLYHANRIIKQHGGKLEVFSEGMGKGTRVKIILKIVENKKQV
ncbi:MAG: sensor histidine kinase [Candidatus Odinarchaeota archaeon]